jgi:hypothetical protein
VTLPVVTSSYFNSLFPELATTPAAVVDALAGIAPLYVGENVFPAPAVLYAQALVIAHLVKLDQLGGGGSLVSDRVGEISTSQAALPTDKGQFQTTTYGQRFLGLARMYRLPVMFAPGGGVRVPPFGGFQDTWGR